MEQENTTDLLQLISFKFGNYYFGINVLNVRAIIHTVQMTSVANSSLFVEGAINLLEEFVPVFNFRVKLNLPSKPDTEEQRIIILDLNGYTFGIVVDEISEILRIPLSTIEEKTEFTNGIDPRFIKATGKFKNQLLFLLNIDEILSGETIAIQ